MPRETKTPPIRVGDRVRILSPLVFDRCGYPLSFDAVLAEVRREHRGKVDEFLAAVGIPPPKNAWDGQPRAVEKILRAVAYELLRRRGHGGKERRIHTRDMPELVGEVRAVAAVRFVKTGDYNPPSRGYWGPDDDVPAYLSNEKTHRILELAGPGWIDDDPVHPFARDRRVEIDAEHVERAES